MKTTWKLSWEQIRLKIGRVLSPWQQTWGLAALLATGLFLLYAAILPERLSWANYGGDGGDFLAAILSGGIPHPSGYPLYGLLGRLFQYLPLGTPVLRGALLSALPAAISAGLALVWIERHILGGVKFARGIALAAGAAWGTAPLVWSQAVIVEVHGLQMLLVVLWLWWLAKLEQGPQEGGSGLALWLLALAAGLSLGNHLTILLLMPAAVAALVMARRKGFSWGFLAGQAALFAAGLAVYGLLPLWARAYPPVNWGNPQTAQGFWWLVSGNPYQGLLLQAPPLRLFERTAAWARLLLEQFGLPGIVLGVAGAVQSPRPRPALRALLLWVFAAYSLFTIVYNTGDSLGYVIPALLAFAIWIGLGLVEAWNWRWRWLPWGALLCVAALVFLAARLPFTDAQVDPRKDAAAADYVERYLLAAPQGALLLTSGDADTFPLWYAHFGLHQRPDLRVVTTPLGAFSWYRETLARVYPDLAQPDMGSGWDQALPRLNPGRPVCRSRVDPPGSATVVFECAP